MKARQRTKKTETSSQSPTKSSSNLSFKSDVSTPDQSSPLLRRKLQDSKRLSKQNSISSTCSDVEQEPLGMSLDGAESITSLQTLNSLRPSSVNEKARSTMKTPKKSPNKLPRRPPSRPPLNLQASEPSDAEEGANFPESSDDMEGGDKKLSVPKVGELVGELPPKNAWPNLPILLRWSSNAGGVTLSSEQHSLINPLDPLLINSSPIHFETSLFSGDVMIRVRNLPELPSDAETTRDYFENRARTLQICIQGKVKRRLCFDQVYSGQEYSRPLKKMPAKRLVKWAFSLLRSRLPDSFTADLFSPLPYYMAPLVLAAKVVRADVDNPPLITDHDIAEDLGYHGVKPIPNNDIVALSREANRGNWRAKQRTAAKLKKAKQKAALNAIKHRKKGIGAPHLLAKQFYEPGVTYTFDYYDSFFRPDSFCLDLGVKKLELCPILGEQPVVLSMAKTIDTGEYLWKFELWHEKSLPDGSVMFKNAETSSS